MSRKAQRVWWHCDKCQACLQEKDTDKHLKDCPPTSFDYFYIHNLQIFGFVDEKSVSQSSLTVNDEHLVFLSETVIQICRFVIGEYVEMDFGDKCAPIVRKVWPTDEKNQSCVLLTAKCLNTCSIEVHSPVRIKSLSVSKLRYASLVTVTSSNIPKKFEFVHELNIRLKKVHQEVILHRDNPLSVVFFGRTFNFNIWDVKFEDNSLVELEMELLRLDEHFFRTNHKTRWQVKREQAHSGEPLKEVIHEFIGLESLKDELSALIKHSFQDGMNKRFEKIRSVILYGHPGTGKSLLASTIARRLTTNVFTLKATELFAQKDDLSAYEMFENIFDEATTCNPSIVIIDDIHLIAPVTTTRLPEFDRKISAKLICQLDLLRINRTRIFVIGITHKLDAVDLAIRKVGRFDIEREVEAPTPVDRLQILRHLLPISTDRIVENISSRTHGFVGADLVTLCQQAHWMQTFDQQSHSYNEQTVDIGESYLIKALRYVKPSAMKEALVELSDVKWSDIGGQASLKLKLQQSIEWPLKHADSFQRLGITPPKGILLFGPPGCCKTMIAKALAWESGLNFLSIKGPELFSKWVGESERAVRELFRKARQVAPSIIFFDEIDALGGERSLVGATASVQERVLAQLLTELDGVSPLNDVTVLAATNRPDRIDNALLRPGRLDRIIYVPLPDTLTRRDIFRIKFDKMPTAVVDMDYLVHATDGYSGAECNAVCHEAALLALEENLDAAYVHSNHILKALDLVKPRTPSYLLQLYEQYLKKND